MADCVIVGLPDPTCEDTTLIGGVKPKNIYVFNREDLRGGSEYNESANGTVTGMNLVTYANAVKLTAMNRTVSATQTQEEGDNLVSYWVQSIVGKFEQQSQTDKNAIESLAAAQELVVVVEKQNSTFEVYGLDYGLKMRGSTKSTGANVGDDNKWNLTFNQTGYGETRPAPDFLNVSYANTKALLESYVA
jgi:hypothetical protein